MLPREDWWRAGIFLLLAGWLFVVFLENPRPRWTWLLHDRSAHHATTLKMAVALENMQPIRFVAELKKSEVWPPLYSLLALPTSIRISRSDTCTRGCLCFGRLQEWVSRRCSQG